MKFIMLYIHRVCCTSKWRCLCAAHQLRPLASEAPLSSKLPNFLLSIELPRDIINQLIVTSTPANMATHHKYDDERTHEGTSLLPPPCVFITDAHRSSRKSGAVIHCGLPSRRKL